MRCFLSFAVGTVVLRAAAADEPICKGKCHDENKDKYFRTKKGSTGALLCEESCLSTTAYDVVRMYNWGIAKANATENPCVDIGYTVYLTNKTYGMSVLSYSADIYGQPPPSAALEFGRGMLDGIGFQNFAGCFDNSADVLQDVKEIWDDFKKGGTIDKAKALAKLGVASKKVVTTATECEDATIDTQNFLKLKNILEDPRYYTLSNALTLALNLAEDRDLLVQFGEDLSANRNYDAGKELVKTMFHVLANPSFPATNGTAAVQFAAGFAEGFTDNVAIKCFHDVHVEIPAIVGGVMQCLSGIGIPAGLESIVRGIAGVVPMYKDCLADRKKIMNFLRLVGDFKDPHSLARLFALNIFHYRLDISIELGQAVLAVHGKNYQRLGLKIGEMLGKIVVPAPNATEVVGKVVLTAPNATMVVI